MSTELNFSIWDLSSSKIVDSFIPGQRYADKQKSINLRNKNSKAEVISRRKREERMNNLTSNLN